MRIGADGSHLRWRVNGFHRYIDGLFTAMVAELPTDDELVVYYNDWPGKRRFDGAAREHFVRLPRPTLWNQVGVPIAAGLDRCDVFLGAAQIVPVRLACPSVVIVYDCLPFRHPESKPGRDGRYWRHWLPRSVHAATRVAAISHWSAAECERYLGFPAEKVTIITPGTDPQFRPATAAEAEVDRQLCLEAGIGSRFVLQVGGREAHKGGGVSERAVAGLRSAGADLTLVRCGGWAAVPGRSDGFLELGQVDDRLLVALYREAMAVCVTSSHEGFGLPVAEAMAVGTPVVATEVSALREAGGDAAMYVAPEDPVAVAAALTELLEDGGEHSRRRALGLEQASRFRWDDSARRALALLAEAAAA